MKPQEAQARLNQLRRVLPHGMWLAYDAILAIVLIGAALRGVWTAYVGLILLVMAVMVDGVEWWLKKQGAR